MRPKVSFVCSTMRPDLRDLRDVGQDDQRLAAERFDLRLHLFDLVLPPFGVLREHHVGARLWRGRARSPGRSPATRR